MRMVVRMQQNLLTARPKTWAMRAIEERTGRPIEDVIRELYVERGMTMRAAAAELGIATGALSRWMVALDIPARGKGKAA